MNLSTIPSLRPPLCLAFCLAMKLQAATADDIQGDWVVDPGATWSLIRKHPDLAADTPQQLEEERRRIVPGFVDLTFTIDKARISVTKDGKKIEESTYTVVAVAGDKVVIEAIGKSTLREKSELTVKDGTLVLVNDNQPGLVMTRKIRAK